MKSLIVIILVLCITALMYVYNLPPRHATIKDLHPTVTPDIETDEPSAGGTTLKDSTAAYNDSTTAAHNYKPTAAYNDTKIQVYYYVIVGSAASQVLAQQKAGKLKNDYKTDFIVLPPTKEGKYRISNGEYASLEKAKSAIMDIRKTIRSDAWIFSVKK
jgi:hypothetical protein